MWPPRESPQACAKGAVAKFMVEQKAQEVQQIFRAAATAAAEAPDQAHQEAAAAAAAHAEITVPGPAVGEFPRLPPFRACQNEKARQHLRNVASTKFGWVQVDVWHMHALQGRQRQPPTPSVPATLLCAGVLSVLQARHWVSSGSGSGCMTHRPSPTSPWQTCWTRTHCSGPTAWLRAPTPSRCALGSSSQAEARCVHAGPDVSRLIGPNLQPSALCPLGDTACMHAPHRRG